MMDWPGPQHYGIVQHQYLALSVPVQTEEDSDLQVGDDPGLICETWILNTDMKRRTEYFAGLWGPLV